MATIDFISEMLKELPMKAAWLWSELLSKATWQHAYEANKHLSGMYLQLLFSAVFPIFTGSYASLSRPSSAAKPAKDDVDTDEEEEETVQKMEGLSPQDAAIFPLTAGLVLSLLYYVINKYGASTINTILGIYFSFVGTYSTGKFISDSVSTLFGLATPNYYQCEGKIWKVVDAERKAVVIDGSDKDASSRTSPLASFAGAIPLPQPLLGGAWALRNFTKKKFLAKGYLEDLLDFRVVFTAHNIVAAILGLTAIGYSFFDKPWWLTNLQGVSVCYGALQLMSPTNFVTGSMILTGLFFYDIWAVFFSPLMVYVATNLDVPIKLVFPRPEDPNFPREEAAKRSYSMLGLGDIVLPGLMIAIALRFDLYLFYLRKQKPGTLSKDKSGKVIKTVEKAPYVSASGNWAEWFYTSSVFGRRSPGLPPHLSSSFPKPYFYASLTGYILGMLATLGIMSVSQHAQPALLYLVPGVLSFIWGTAVIRGETRLMWEFTEAVDDESVDADKKDDKKDDMTDDMKDDKKNDKKDEQQEPEEAGSLFSKVYRAIFGDSSKEEKPAEVNEEIIRPADIGKDVVFSFTIAHHSPTSKSKSGQDTGASPKKTPEQAGHRSQSASTDEDAVLVGSADLEGDKKAS